MKNFVRKKLQKLLLDKVIYTSPPVRYIIKLKNFNPINHICLRDLELKTIFGHNSAIYNLIIYYPFPNKRGTNIITHTDVCVSSPLPLNSDQRYIIGCNILWSIENYPRLIGEDDYELDNLFNVIRNRIWLLSLLETKPGNFGQKFTQNDIQESDFEFIDKVIIEF